MANELHRKILVAEAAADFDTNFAEIDDLPAGDICWCKPITTLGDCDMARLYIQLSSGDATPEGSLEVWVGRKNVGGSAIGSGSGLTLDEALSDHGKEADAADVTRLLACLDLTAAFTCDASANVKYTAAVDVRDPGDSFQIFVYNRSDEQLDGTSSPHKIYVEGWGWESQ